jgi:NDP-sugar pyrophosphorylase family protein
MGNALWQARNFLKGYFFVLNADVLNCEEILKEMLKKIKKEKKPCFSRTKNKNSLALWNDEIKRR